MKNLPGRQLTLTSTGLPRATEMQRKGVEIESVSRQVRIVQKGPLRVAVAVEEGPELTSETVEAVCSEIRERGK